MLPAYFFWVSNECFLNKRQKQDDFATSQNASCGWFDPKKSQLLAKQVPCVKQPLHTQDLLNVRYRGIPAAPHAPKNWYVVPVMIAERDKLHGQG
jgi:hypothetical protein